MDNFIPMWDILAWHFGPQAIHQRIDQKRRSSSRLGMFSHCRNAPSREHLRKQKMSTASRFRHAFLPVPMFVLPAPKITFGRTWHIEMFFRHLNPPSEEHSIVKCWTQLRENIAYCKVLHLRRAARRTFWAGGTPGGITI